VLAPKDIAARLRRHFAQASPDDFRANVKRYCPEVIGSETPHQPIAEEASAMGQLILFQPQSSALPLEAYLACALTGLNSDQRQLVFHLSDVVALVCREYGIELYEPRKKTDPVHHADVADADVFRTDRERVLRSDLLIHLCHYPSTGAGEELDFAYSALVPIILISHGESRVSRMITGIPAFKLHIQYTEPEDLRAGLQNALIQARPILEERKMAFSSYDANIVGNRIRLLREELGLTRDEVARSVPHLTTEALRQVEESTDRLSNPSLLQLRQIATILKTTVADLVEPELSERVLAVLQDWISGKAAARFGGLTIKDRNRILRRVLLRLVDSLETDVV
jgi:transcriptional regulator with XRE-family HTH domain